MTALLVIGTTAVGAILGGVAGSWYEEHKTASMDDYGIGQLLYVGAGTIIGGAVGVTVGAIVFI